jgi:hypothetical protein
MIRFSWLRSLRQYPPRILPKRRGIAVRRRVQLSLEALEDRVTPSTVPAFTGLTVAVSHFLPPDPCIQQSPVFDLNFQHPPDPCTPLGALLGAFNQVPPSAMHSPVFVGVEAFLSGGGSTAS